MIQIRVTDKMFSDSPDAGRPTCICSRCGGRISENECPIRCWPESETETNDDGSKKIIGEYRFCEDCQVKTMGIHISPRTDEII